MFPRDFNCSTTEFIDFFSCADFLGFFYIFGCLLAFCETFRQLPSTPFIEGNLAIFEGWWSTVKDITWFYAVVDDAQSTVEHTHQMTVVSARL